MHICFITSEFPKPGYPHGGVGSFIKMLGTALVKHNIAVSVVGLNYDHLPTEEVVVDGIKVIRIKPSTLKGISWLCNSKAINRKINDIHKKHPINVVETAELGLAFINKIPGITYLIRMHGGHHFFANVENRKLEKWKAMQEKWSFKKADKIIAVSNFVGKRTQELLPVSFDYQTIYNPIDCARFFQSDNRYEKYSILFAGSLVEKKGIRQLVQAIKIVKKSYPKVQLYIAGKFGNMPGTKASYEPVLIKEVTSEIEENIKFLGLVPNTEMPNYINRAHICCYPSHMEAMPIAWLEVMAMGKVFITSNTGPGPEIITDGINGFLVNPYSPEDIAQKIIEVFQMKDILEIQSNARKHVVENFSLNKIATENIFFYKQIITA